MTLWLLIIPAVAQAAPLVNPGPDLFLADTSADFVCTTQMTQRYPYRCPAYSPGARQVRLQYLRSTLPDPLPELAVEEIEVPEDAITPYTFAYIRPLPAVTYRHPEEAAVGLPPVREFLAGDNWVSILGEVEYNGQRWYEINENEFILADHVALTTPSRFHGVLLQEQPQYPFGWINRDVNPSLVPGGVVRDEVVFHRYDLITIFAQESVGDKMWYMIGQDQWVEQSFTSRVDVDPLPEGVAPNEKWIEVNTYEQTLAAYEGERMVFATLVSSGRSDTWTPNGLHRIWSKLPATPMINRDVGPDSPAWYYLEDVPWTQYFDGAFALHAAYWHNSFSFTRSHGCVNLSILDAKWLFEWTTPYTPPDAKVVYSSASGDGAGTWVWVHKTSPFPGEEE
ncbi:MAG TPA: L,D-transpeptidase [Anaerolineae bacterium]|nr:L,D-transpeptidase [Anaerolineae bacterium]HQH37409.1 L,D-transpeptidase [Anaerolineae bacterium]